MSASNSTSSFVFKVESAAGFAKVVAVVAGIDDHRVLGEAKLIEGRQQAAEIFVHAGDVAEVVEVDGIVGEAGSVLASLGVRFFEDGRDGAIRRGTAGFAGVEVAEAFEEILTATRAVGALVTNNYRKRPVAILLYPFDRKISADIVAHSPGGG